MSLTLTDSHCHLDRLVHPEGEGLDDALARAGEQGVERFLCVAISRENQQAVLDLAQDYEPIFASVGAHPNEREGAEYTVEELAGLAALPKVLAVGETGLDYFRSEGDLEWQRERFRVHIAAAKAAQKPLIIHCREARTDTLKLLAEEGADAVGGVMHCFVEDQATADAAMEMGFYISFSGILTFNSAADLREVAKRIPEDRLLVETDAPYLAPVPHRGKPNEPAYVRHVAECLAELRGVSVEAIAEQTEANFERLFLR